MKIMYIAKGEVGELVSTIAVQHEVLFVVCVDKRFKCWPINECQELTEKEYKEWQQKKTNHQIGTR